MPIDYKSFGPTQPGAASPMDTTKKWWVADNDTEMAQAIAGTIASLKNADAKRVTQYNISARLYGNTSIMGINGLSFTQIQSVQATLKDRVTYNIIQSVIDTLVSKLTKNKPKPTFLTQGGSWKLHRQAKKLDKFIDGIFYENDIYKLATQILKDALIFGDGVVHVFDDNGRCKMERVIPSELYIDQMESFYGFPRQIHRLKNVDRDVLMALYPDKKDIILQTESAKVDQTGTFQNVADQIVVAESWHLPSTANADDGLHTIAIDNAILFQEKYTKSVFPFARFSWSERIYGFWAQGLAEQLQNLQLEVNKLLWIIQRSMHLAGTFKVFLEHGSKIVKEHVSNDIGVLINYTGTPPQYVTPPVVPPEIYAHLQTLEQKAFMQSGISMLSATSQKPAGLNSGAALREYNDIETERFMAAGFAYERFFIDVSKLAVSTVKDIFEREGKYEVMIPGKHYLETIDWKEVKLEDNQYSLKIFPVSKLPSDPAGQLQTITEYIQAGFITPRAGRRLLDFPDLERAEDLSNAQEDYLTKKIEEMIDDGKIYHPEPDDDLNMAREIALQYLPYAKMNGADEMNLQILRDFIAEIDQLSQMATAPMQAQAPAPMQLPQTPEAMAAQSLPPGISENIPAMAVA